MLAREPEQLYAEARVLEERAARVDDARRARLARRQARFLLH